MPGENLLAGTASNYALFHRHVVQVILSRLQVGSEISRRLFYFVSQKLWFMQPNPVTFENIIPIVTCFGALSRRILCMHIHSVLQFGLSGTRAPVFSDSYVLSLMKETMVLLPSCLCGQSRKSSVCKLLHESCIDMKLGLLASSRPPEVPRSRCDLSWYPYDLDEGLVSCIVASTDLFPKRQNRGTALAGCKLLEVSVIFVEFEFVFLLEVKVQMRQFLATSYHGGFEASLAAAPKEAASIDMLAGELDGETDWD